MTSTVLGTSGSVATGSGGITSMGAGRNTVAGVAIPSDWWRRFSWARGLSRGSVPVFPQFARLAAEEYGAQQVWCKDSFVSRSAGRG
ncbi:hypothetical protein MKUB_41090 [Mycobacterium kubicae]|uniref:Uncharacterized protein n=2 Tax=Mycobacterium TaxID=1763 RepID=A0AAI8SJW8_MYCAV|nr:hypothetical protein JPH1_10150 [Mycobacterium avium subsp. hominissuis]GFG66619.1 hypothetical protein MKUB_41090 [Mycobacterium kubicae]